MRPSSKNTGVGRHLLFQRTFATQGSTLFSYIPCIGRQVLVQFSSVQLLSRTEQLFLTVLNSSEQLFVNGRLFVTPCTAAHQASLSITNSRSSLKLMSIESVMPPSHLILSHPLLLLPSIFPSIRVFSK